MIRIGQLKIHFFDVEGRRRQTGILVTHSRFRQGRVNASFKQDKFDKFISPDEGLFERNM